MAAKAEYMYMAAYFSDGEFKGRETYLLNSFKLLWPFQKFLVDFI